MAHRLACPRYPVAKLQQTKPPLLPQRYIESLEQNQQISHCCRHPENHDVEAFYSSEKETAPDIYIFHCTCGRRHIRFCVGQGDVRPTWEVR